MERVFFRWCIEQLVIDSFESVLKYRYHSVEKSRSNYGTKGFTLLELLVEIANIAILAALLLPALTAAKQKAQGISGMDNRKQPMLALHLYGDDFNGWLPSNPDWTTTNVQFEFQPRPSVVESL